MRQAARLPLTASSQILTHLSQNGVKRLLSAIFLPRRHGDTEVFPFLTEENRNRQGSTRTLRRHITRQDPESGLKGFGKIREVTKAYHQGNF